MNTMTLGKRTKIFDPAEPLEPDDERFCQAALSAPFAGKAAWLRLAESRTEPLPRDKQNAYVRANKPCVIARIAWLQEQEASRRAFTRNNLREFLEGVIMTPVSDITEESPLAQEVHYHEDGKVARVKGPDKMRAAELLARMNGWDRQEGEAGPLIAAQVVVMNVLNAK